MNSQSHLDHQNEESSAGNSNLSAKKLSLTIFSLFLLVLFWHVVTDRLAPSSSRGAVKAYVTQLSPKVAGQVTQVFVHDGEMVSPGQPLFALDDRVYQLAVKQAENQLASAIKSTKANSAAILSSQASVNEALVNLENIKTSTSRTLALARRNLLSSSRADDAKAELKAAQASYEKAKASLESAILALGADDDRNLEVQASRLALEKAQLDLEYATVTAPTQGVITNLSLAIGQYVAPKNPALTFIDSRGAWISVDLRENQLGNVSVGDQVDVAYDAVPGEIFKGEVKAIAWGIDPGRSSANGLQKNPSFTQWFEPARKIPVHIELTGGMEQWPEAAKAGGKVNALIYAKGDSNIVAWISGIIFYIQSYISYLY
ncbi:HlyD family secretion protein [Bacterioplanoides sp. SCSIO 12839]|uniref:HlyD family secretion protein n=1 Tax=Bacterioplanoides sp. SCSIO 12839 TaxID=2829569 RepID=UPI0021052739|nr:HlyD family secretion protein [Bacterioplanoides sp. SCSIO 12839]UTW49301.1 HlyD family secretion protein [Bacterioplanoides sp. SCSIO 12839]